MRIVEELMKIWPNEACDTYIISVKDRKDGKQRNRVIDRKYSGMVYCTTSENR